MPAAPVPRKKPVTTLPRESVLQAWLDALRRNAGKEELGKLPPLSDEDKARLIGLLEELVEASEPGESAEAESETEAEIAAGTDSSPSQFRPRLTLQTLTRGDGLLGMRAMSGFGPRSAQVTVAQVDWTYAADRPALGTPAPTRVLNTRPSRPQLLRGAWGQHVTLRRDLPAEADAATRCGALGPAPLPPQALQWRNRDAALGHENLWTLPRSRTSATSGPSRCPAPGARLGHRRAAGLRAPERAGRRVAPRHRP
jgi:hypothetical protein